ncbi:MAG: hypothetical protein FJ011_26755 [Chloroflexi bacterium]|nr:hypothetical protein [Chloroflexota bacterium]
MKQPGHIAPHEPEEELLSADDAWQDFLSLRQALAAGSEALLQIDRATQALVHDLIVAGVARSAEEVIRRAVQSFYVATYPQADRRLPAVRETRQD